MAETRLRPSAKVAHPDIEKIGRAKLFVDLVKEAVEQIRHAGASMTGVANPVSVDADAVKNLVYRYFEKIEKLREENDFPEGRRANRPKVAALLIHMILRDGAAFFKVNHPDAQNLVVPCFQAVCNLVMVTLLKIPFEEMNSKKFERETRAVAFNKIRKSKDDNEIFTYLLMPYMESYWNAAKEKEAEMESNEFKKP